MTAEQARHELVAGEHSDSTGCHSAVVRAPEALVAVASDADSGGPTAGSDRVSERVSWQDDLFQTACAHAAKVPPAPGRARPIRHGTLIAMTNPLSQPTSGLLSVQGASSAMWFEVPQIRSKSNFRRSGAARSWNQIRSFEDEVAIRARAARPASWPLGDPADELAKRPRLVAVLIAETLIDAGNATKSLFDALEGVLYHNDASIRAEMVITERVRQGRSFLAFAVCDASDRHSLVAVTSGLAAGLLTVLDGEG